MDGRKELDSLVKYITGTSSSRKTLCGLYAGFSLSSLIFIISISQNLDIFQSNGVVLLLISAFFLFIFASRTFYKVEEYTYRIMIKHKTSSDIFQFMADLDLKNKKASKMLSAGQIILLLTAIFFGLAFIWPFWTFFQ
ncbi:MAG: hypothetical protein ACFFEO_04540 [Candidatus Thorarchaeota archaeon]